jgi:5-methylcytosine-specific restriction endonuclease McrA
VLDRNGFTCQMRGLCTREIDPDTGRKVRLHLGHVVDKNLGGKDELSNLRALCSTCNQGAKNLTGEKPSGVWLLSQVRRAGQDEQRAVLAYLQNKFATDA